MLNIVILEDNRDRQLAMQECLNDRFHQYQIVFFDNAGEMCAFLKANLGSILIISLDHDLELKMTSDGTWEDPGTGRDVADYLATQSPTCPIVIHSTNSAAGDGMQFVLEEAQWTAQRVHPFGDLEWIPSKWFRTIRNAVVASAQSRTKTPSRIA